MYYWCSLKRYLFRRKLREARLRPLLTREDVKELETCVIDGVEIHLWIFPYLLKKRIDVDVFGREDKPEYNDIAVDRVVKRVLENNPILKLSHPVKLEVRLGYHSSEIHFKKKPFWERLFLKK